MKIKKYNCLTCQKETSNPKFCSRSCAATFNNHVHPKRVKDQIYCNGCGEEITTRERAWRKRKYCKECRYAKLDNITVGRLREESSYNYSIRVCANARYILKKSKVPQVCRVCGYTKHVEVCHIKSVRSFDDNALISEINSLNNLAYLCPNCHWELDNTMLTLPM